ncbi:MAG: hypothetical protein U0798_05945 [Gemmataceae bacterium]
MAEASGEERRNIWGVLGGRIFFLGDQLAPNGLEYKPLFSLDTELNFWFWREQRVYGFVETRFWGQRAGPGVTNPKQGAFDFSKRELDLNVGTAWNYSGPFEFRAFAYSFNNLNRGDSSFSPAGYNDGVGLENRWYFAGNYEDMGLARFDVTRTSFIGLGYYPTKVMTDEKGNDFKPGLFLHGRVNYDLKGESWYLYADSQFICKRAGSAKYLFLDTGTAIRPFARNTRLEYRFGTDNKYDFELKRFDTEVYLSLRLTF